MKLAKRAGCLLLCLCMIFPMLPLGTMAEDSLCPDCQSDPCTCPPKCTGDDSCTLTEGHNEGCPKLCGGFEGCHDGTHSEDCALFVCPECEGKAGNHTDTCPTRCTGDDTCPLTENHQTGCPKTCTGGESCANGHVSPCPLFVCPECEGKAGNHTDTCPTRCTGDDTCPLTENHQTGCPKTCTGGESCADGHVSPCPLAPAEPPQPRGGESLTFTLCRADDTDFGSNSMPYVDGDPARMRIRVSDGTYATEKQITTDPADNVEIIEEDEVNHILKFVIASPQPNTSYAIYYKATEESQAIPTGLSLFVMEAEGEDPEETPAFRLYAPNGTYLDSGIINITIGQGGTPVTIKLPDDTCVTAGQIVLDTDKVTCGAFESTESTESTLLMFNGSAPGTYNVLYREVDGTPPVDTGLRVVVANNPDVPTFSFYSPPDENYPDGMKLQDTQIEANDLKPVEVVIRLGDGTRVTADQIVPIEGLKVTDGNDGILIFNFTISALYALSYKETPDSTPIEMGLSFSVHAKRLLFYAFEPGKIDPYARVRLEAGDSISVPIRYTPDETYESSIPITADQLTSPEGSGITLDADPADDEKTIITAGNVPGNWDIFYYGSSGPGGHSVAVTVKEKGTFSFYQDGNSLDASMDAVNGTPFTLTIKRNTKDDTDTITYTYVTASQIVPVEGLTVEDAENNALRFTPTKDGTYQLSYKADSNSDEVDMEFAVNVTTPPPFLFYDDLHGQILTDFAAMNSPHPLEYPLEAKIKHTASGKYLNKKQIVTDEGSSITVSDSTTANTVEIRFSGAGTYNLYYKETETSQPIWFGTVEVEPASAGIVEGQLDTGALVARGAYLGSDNFNAAYMEPGKSYEVMFAILGKNDQLTPVDPDMIWSTSDRLKIEKVDGDESLCKITVLSGGNGYFRTENATASFHAYAHGAEAGNFLDDQEALLASEDGSNFVPTLTLAVNEETTVSLRYGSTGASVPVTALENAVNPADVVSLAANNDGTFTLKGLKVGTAMLSYKNASGEKGLKVNVVAARAENKHLFVLGGVSGQATYLSLTPGGSQQATFYFGTFSDYEKVDIHASSNLTVQKNEGGYLVTAGAAGNGLIWYEKGGIAYTMPVMIGTNNEGSNSQPSNTAVIDGITYTTAMLLEETLDVMSNFGQDYTETSTMDFNQSIVLAAMKNDALDAGAFSNISDFTASFMYCTEDVDETKPANHAKLNIIAPKVPGINASTSGVAVQAEAKKGFRGMLAISFTITDPDEPMPRRITLQCPIAYNLRTGDVVITISADSELDTAAELNVILSSCFAFNYWLNDPGDGVSISGRYRGGHITIHLPAIAYTDGIVVAQMVPQPGGYNPSNTISLVGHGTTMAGLVSKGGLSSVSGISFVANENVTMTHGGETFTCGILSASDYSDTNNAPFDAAYTARYCDIDPAAPNSMAYALQRSSFYLNSQPADAKWGLATIYDVDNCSFEGYDYGVRSTTTGVVGGGAGCSFEYCHYGIYMDSNGFGVSAGNPHNVDYSGFNFENNKYAVRLVSLPGGATPYVFRIHDSDFANNHFDFHITPEGDYYFYRNYFGGYWREHDHHGRWKHFKGHHHFDLDAEELRHKANQNEGHRAYRAIEDDGVRIFATLARDGVTNSGYRIYHDRRNRYLTGSGKLPVSHTSIEELPERTELEIASESNGTVTVNASFVMGGGSK